MDIRLCCLKILNLYMLVENGLEIVMTLVFLRTFVRCYIQTKIFIKKGNTNIIDTYLKSWTDNNIPKNKIILSFQTQSGAGGDEPRLYQMIQKGNSFIKLLTDKLNEGYAGLLGWPPVYNNNNDQSKAD